MPYPQKHPLRTLSQQEERALCQIAKASSERVDTVRRAKAVLAVHAGEAFTVAAALSGFKSADSVSQLVERFNQQGLAALSIAAGRGRQPTYTSSQRQQILERLRSSPNREQEQSATWSRRLAATGPAPRPAAVCRSQYHPSRLAQSKLRLRTQPHLVQDRHGGARAQSGRGHRPRSTDTGETTLD